MSTKITKFETTLDRVNVTYAFAVPISFLTFATALLWVFNPSYFQPQSFMLFCIILAIVAITGVINYFFINYLNPRNAKPIYVVYHSALAVLCVFVAPYLSGYAFLWIMLAQSMDLIYKKKWLYFTIAFYLLSLAGSFYITKQTLDSGTLLQTALQAISIYTLSLLISSLRKISDEEREVLDSSSRETAFERQRLLSLINNMGEAVIATNNTGKILLYNAAALNLLDTNQTLDKKPIHKILHLKDEKERQPVDIISEARKHPAGYTSRDLIYEFTKDDFMNMYINISAIKLGFKQESEDGFIVLLRDITKEKSLEEERDEFISVVSHELRTPVAIAEGDISNALFMSQKNHDPKVITESLSQAHDQVVFLASMINDLATLSRAERVDVAMEVVSIQPGDMLQALGQDYKPQAEAKKLTVQVSAAKDVRPIQSSELYLREVLQNFVTNAVKYTKKGSVLLHVRSNKNGDAVFSVSDTGIGLSKTDQKRVFEKFFRSEDYRTRESSGTGLGLYVTAKLAHRLNATIELESQLNKGSTFTITVPSLKEEN